jgi:hypothetical protein
MKKKPMSKSAKFKSNLAKLSRAINRMPHDNWEQSDQVSDMRCYLNDLAKTHSNYEFLRRAMKKEKAKLGLELKRLMR